MHLLRQSKNHSVDAWHKDGGASMAILKPSQGIQEAHIRASNSGSRNRSYRAIRREELDATRHVTGPVIGEASGCFPVWGYGHCDGDVVLRQERVGG